VVDVSETDPNRCLQAWPQPGGERSAQLTSGLNGGQVFQRQKITGLGASCAKDKGVFIILSLIPEEIVKQIRKSLVLSNLLAKWMVSQA